MAHYGDYQNLIYGDGLQGVIPRLPVDFATLVKRAEAAMPPQVLNYVQGGCGDEWTQDSNVAAFHRWGMIPRMMVDTSTRDLSVELFGVRFPSPIFMSPIGVNGICTPDGHGDLHAARASALSGVPFCATTLTNDPLEKVAEAAGDTPGFFQLYTPRHKELAESLVSRAERAGYKAIVVTLDTWLSGWRPRDLNVSNFPMLRGLVLQNYFSDPVFRSLMDRPP
ncbi:MAG: alpha-hydroxy-acid oxidizing protein, partial [Planctomycetaceae bacterium]|nr:alpha-hydroxy-acid oxidizing protein [Planctomycetaceae bacterium]